MFFFIRTQAIKITRSGKIKGFLKEVVIVSQLSILIINTVFINYKTGKSLSEYNFSSSKLKNYQKEFFFVGRVPIPVPEPFIKGFDNIALNVETPPGTTAISSYGATFFLDIEFLVNELFLIILYVVCINYQFLLCYFF